MDRRDIVNTKYRPYKVDEQAKQITLYLDDEGEIKLQLEWGICPTCQGNGTHVNPSIDSHGLSSEDFYEDPDFKEDYCSGRYNVPCYECNGRRVIATSSDPRFIKAVEEFWRDEAADKHTRMMENGGY